MIKRNNILFTVLMYVLLCWGWSPPFALGQDDDTDTDGLDSNISSPQPLPCCDDSHSSSGEVVNERRLEIPNSSKVIRLWEEVRDNGTTVSFFSIDDSVLGADSSTSESFERVRQANYSIPIRYGIFDPLSDDSLAVDAELQAIAESELYLLQFWTVPIKEYRQNIEELGGKVYRYLPDHTYIVRMSAAAASELGQSSYVRWVGEFHPAYKLDKAIITSYENGLDNVEGVQEGKGEFFTKNEYSIEVFQRADGGAVIEQAAAPNDAGNVPPAPKTNTLQDTDEPEQQAIVKAAIEALGGIVSVVTPGGFRMQATLTMNQLLQVAQMNEVHFIEPWGFGGTDMDIVREIGGANVLENTLGFTGQGVRAEVFDTEILSTHTEFSLLLPTLHSTGTGTGSPHGTSVYSHMFARGASANARGLLPDADTGYFYAYNESTQFGGSETRLQIAQELTATSGTISQGVVQTSSVGSARNTSYSSISSEMDDVIFQTGLLHTQSQSNAGTATNGTAARLSRPQAWAKNIVSVGAVNHYGTLSRSDDTWVNSSGTSVGPAEDGRIKPDLCFFYDQTLAANNNSNTSYTNFGGTSGATPTVAGHMGLFHQMWHENTWEGSGMLTSGSGTVFSNRPKAMLAKAALINTAYRYDWTPGTARNLPGSIDRYVQGWGMPDLENLYDLRAKTFYVNESNILAQGQNKLHIIKVASGEPDLNVTMTYMDPEGTTSAALHRINDLSLKVTSPSGIVYWGNNGLTASNVSTSGGSSNTKDTVENVFIPNPEAGQWFVQIFADAVVQDAHVETATMDADYALWVTGGTESSSLKTTYLGNNAQNGAMFDITAHETITITGFDIPHTDITNPVTIEVYSTLGGYAGNETNAGAWTLLGTDTIQANGTNVATFVDIGDLTIKPGETYGIYITDIGTASGSMRYTNGSESFDNGEIQINTGVGIAYPFAQIFTPRTWNGTVYYSTSTIADEPGPYAYSSQSNGDDKLYRINLRTGQAKAMGDAMTFGDAEGMSIGPKGTVYAIGGSVEELWNVGSPPGGLIGSTGTRNGLDAGLAYNADNGMLYNINGSSGNTTLYKVNPQTGSTVAVGTTTTYLDGLAIRGNGTAFATDWITTDSLYTVNLSNGNATLVGSLGLGDVSSQSGLAFLGDTLYAITSAGEIYTINTSTGAATFVNNVTIDGLAVANGWESLAITPCSGATPTKLENFNATYSSTSHTRGYWFTAPTDFLITGLRVPDETNAGVQNVEVVRLHSQPPNLNDDPSQTMDDPSGKDFIDATTNSFVSLFRRIGVTGKSIIHTTIPVRAGDIIGILGAAGTTTMKNSYASSNEYSTKILGESVTLKRMGMQYNLNTTQAQDLWTVDGGAFSRVEMYYIQPPDVRLNADTVATGSTLDTTPLATGSGTISATGTVEIRSGVDPEQVLAGSSGNVLDILDASHSAEIFFNFNVESITFNYGGNSGKISVEARDSNGAVVDSFSQIDTYGGQPAGPQTLAGAGIRSIYWEDPLGNYAPLDNMCIRSGQKPMVIAPILMLLLNN